MRNRFYAQNLGIGTVVQRERKAPQYEPSKSGIHRRPGFEVLEKERRRSENLGLESLAQTRNFGFVVHGCFDQFHLGVGMELQLHRFKRCRRFSSTRSPGTG